MEVSAPDIADSAVEPELSFTCKLYVIGPVVSFTSLQSKVGVLSFVIDWLAGSKSVGASGGVVSGRTTVTIVNAEEVKCY